MSNQYELALHHQDGRDGVTDDDVKSELTKMDVTSACKLSYGGTTVVDPGVDEVGVDVMDVDGGKSCPCWILRGMRQHVIVDLLMIGEFEHRRGV